MTQSDFSTRTQPFLLEGGENCVLLIHGFTGSPPNMRPLGDALHDVGYTVQGILLPGHGTTLEDMRISGGYQPWRNAARDAFDALAAKYRTVSVMGLSMGGVLTLLLATERPVHAAVSIASPMRVYNHMARIAPLIAPFRPLLAHKKVPAGERSEFLRTYGLGYPATPLHRVGDLNRLMRDAEKSLAQVRCPLLVVQSRDDDTVVPVSADIIYQGAGSTDKRLLWLERSGHVCTLGAERETLFATSIDFLREVSAR